MYCIAWRPTFCSASQLSDFAEVAVVTIDPRSGMSNPISVFGLPADDFQFQGIGFLQHMSITASNVVGVNGLRRQRAAPSSSAMRRKSGAGLRCSAKT